MFDQHSLANSSIELPWTLNPTNANTNTSTDSYQLTETYQVQYRSPRTKSIGYIDQILFFQSFIDHPKPWKSPRIIGTMNKHFTSCRDKMFSFSECMPNVYVHTDDDGQTSFKRKRLNNSIAAQFGLAFGTAWKTFQQSA